MIVVAEETAKSSAVSIPPPLGVEAIAISPSGAPVEKVNGRVGYALVLAARRHRACRSQQHGRADADHKGWSIARVSTTRVWRLARWGLDEVTEARVTGTSRGAFSDAGLLLLERLTEAPALLIE